MESSQCCLGFHSDSCFPCWETLECFFYYSEGSSTQLEDMFTLRNNQTRAFVSEKSTRSVCLFLSPYQFFCLATIEQVPWTIWFPRNLAHCCSVCCCHTLDDDVFLRATVARLMSIRSSPTVGSSLFEKNRFLSPPSSLIFWYLARMIKL